MKCRLRLNVFIVKKMRTGPMYSDAGRRGGRRWCTRRPGARGAPPLG